MIPKAATMGRATPSNQNPDQTSIQCSQLSLLFIVEFMVFYPGFSFNWFYQVLADTPAQFSRLSSFQISSLDSLHDPKTLPCLVHCALLLFCFNCFLARPIVPCFRFYFANQCNLHMSLFCTGSFS